MQQQFRGLLIAVVLLGLLGAGVYWSNKDAKESEGKPAKDAPPKILQIPDSEITQVEFRKKGAEPTIIHRAGNVNWDITSPKKLRGDPDAITPVLNLLSSLNSDSLVEEKVQDWTPFGLKEPSFEIVISKKDGKNTALQIGDDLPAGSAMYARVAGESRLFTIASFNRASLDKSWKDLRDKRLLTVESDKLSRMEFTSGPNTVEFGKIGSGEWQIVKPNPFRADNFAVDEASRKLKDSKMDPNVSDEDAAKAEKAFAGAAVVGVAKLTDASGTQQLEIRKTRDKEPVYYAKSSQIEGVHKIGADVAAVLEKKAEDYRNKKLFEFGFTDPTRVEIKMDGTVKQYGKNGEKWFLNGKEMKPETVQNLIDKLRDLSATKFTAGSKEAAGIEITVVSNEGKKTEVVKIAGTLAARGDEPYQYDIGAAAVEELRKAANEIAVVDAPKPDGKKK
jgi:hypothetical protein